MLRGACANSSLARVESLNPYKPSRRNFLLEAGLFEGCMVCQVVHARGDPRNREVGLEEFARRNGLELLKIFKDVGVLGS